MFSDVLFIFYDHTLGGANLFADSSLGDTRSWTPSFRNKGPLDRFKHFQPIERQVSTGAVFARLWKIGRIIEGFGVGGKQGYWVAIVADDRLFYVVLALLGVANNHYNIYLYVASYCRARDEHSRGITKLISSRKSNHRSHFFPGENMMKSGRLVLQSTNY